MDKESISILMPVKNASDFIDRCLLSIVQQHVNWELVVVDDHSSDDSFEKLSQWATKYDQIRLIKNQGSGIIKALNTAFSHSTHELVTRMDIDDEMPKDKLNVLLQHWTLIRSEDPVVVGKVKYRAEHELGGGYKRYEEWVNGNLQQTNVFSHIYEECVLPSCAWLMSARRFNELELSSNWSYPEDYDLCFKIYERGIPVKMVDKTVHYWFDHSQRTSRTSEVYSDQDFFDLKLAYFTKIDLDQNKTPILWGAGRKGKKLAKKLNELGLEFVWVTDNQNKTGHVIYNQVIQAVPELINWEKHQVLLALSGPKDKTDVVERLESMSGIIGMDYYIFVN